jgi:hypothetical protein
MAVTESRPYYSLLTSAAFQNCQQGMFTIYESEFPLYHKATPSCLGALYFAKHELAHEHCKKVIFRKDLTPVWIHQKIIPNFWVYSLPMPTKVTETCKVKGVTKILMRKYEIQDSCMEKKIVKCFGALLSVINCQRQH